MVRTTFYVAALSLLAVLPTRAARAQPADSASEAHRWRGEAAQAFDAGDFATCQDKAKEAIKLAKEPQTVGLLGLCEAEAHLWRDAAEHLDYAIHFDPKTERVAQYKEKLGQIKPRVAALAVTTAPPGATITIDGKDMGSTPATVFVDPGHYKLSAEKDGLAATSEVDAVAGGEKDVSLKLEPVSPSSATSARARPVWPGIALLGVGAATLAVAGGLIAVHGADIDKATMLGKGLHCDPSNLSPPCQAVFDKASAAQTTGNAAGGLFIAGGVAVVVGGALLIWTTTGASSKAATKTATAITVVPVASRQGGGLEVGGLF